LEGEIDRETVRVVEGEGLLAGEHRRTGPPGRAGRSLEQLGPRFESLEKRDLLGDRGPLDAVEDLDGVRVGRAHRVPDRAHELGHGGAVHPSSRTERTMRRSSRRRTYPRPSLPGITPSEMSM